MQSPTECGSRTSLWLNPDAYFAFLAAILGACGLVFAFGIIDFRMALLLKILIVPPILFLVGVCTLIESFQRARPLARKTHSIDRRWRIAVFVGEFILLVVSFLKPASWMYLNVVWCYLAVALYASRCSAMRVNHSASKHRRNE